MSSRTLHQPVRAEGVGAHEGRPCAVILHPAQAGHGIVFVTEDEAFPADGAHVEGGDGLVFYGELSEVAGAEALLASLALTGITDVRIDIVGGEVPVDTLGAWVARLGLPEGRAPAVPSVDEAVFVSGDRGYAALVPAPAAVAVRLDNGPGCVGEGMLPLEPALLLAELGTARPVRFDLETAHAEGRWLGLNTTNCATREAELASPDEGLRWHMVCALAGLAIAPRHGRLELVGPDLEPLARVLAAIPTAGSAIH